MSIGGVKQRLFNDIIGLLFGEPAAILADAITTYGPCPLGLAAQASHFPIEDAKTVALSLYAHGVLNITDEGKHKYVSVSSLPAYVLSAPSLLIDPIEEQYKNAAMTETLKIILFHGIIEYHPKADKSKKKKSTAFSPPIDLPDGFGDAIEKLLEIGILVRRVIECESFTTTDYYSLRRRIENITISKKRSAASNPNLADLSNLPSSSELSSKSAAPTDSLFSLTINWPGVASFLRGRSIVQFAQAALGNDYTKLIENIIEVTKCSDYSSYQRSMAKDDDSLRGELLPFQRLEYNQIVQKYENNLRDDLFTLLDTISDSQMEFLRGGSDGSFWDITTAHSVRAFQIHHIEMYLEQTLSPYHRRCFNQLRILGVADTHQIEVSALLSEKDARSSMYALCKLGFAQMQSIPRSSTDRMINPKSIFVWRYDEEAAIEAYRLLIGEHARRYLARITELHKEYEANEMAEAGNMTATKTNEKKEKHLCCFNASYADAMRVFVLFAEL